MIQIFTTQLSGKMKAIKEKHEEVIEDCSRMIAQSVVSGHSIFLFAVGEMKSVIPQFIDGSDGFTNVNIIETSKDLPTIEDQDTIFIFSPSSHNEAALEMAHALTAVNQAFIAIIGATDKDHADGGLHSLTDLTIQLQTSPMVPTDEGSRVGTPTALLALYVFHCLHLTTVDILTEYECR
ncbi:DUF2529 family protein [Alkalihalobacterium sp. APHAB7]|uniref:DUF2529 family protein n=1 Tax=Alkalihalobacterium sp. APHAB7 TaxID=3402081 RepID=UPI003AABA375